MALSRKRADQRVVDAGLAASRSRAQALILAGAICEADGTPVHKAGALLAANAALQLRHQPLPFVSRGGLKLAAALDHFGVRFGTEPRGKLCLDVGASTGGFTDCLLQRGARRVYAVDVGHNQLAWALRQRPDVIVRERLNIRAATKALLPEAAELVVVDVSFISLRTVLPLLLPFAEGEARLIALLKPQFEVGAKRLGKGGIVRDPEARAAAQEQIEGVLIGMGCTAVAAMPSPILGAKGNAEILLHAVFPAQSGHRD